MRWDVFFVFFIKQKTAYEWRISDWSSDVCSSDLDLLARHGAALCVHDLLADHPWERTTDWAYVRFHGPRALEQPYHGAYGPAGLAGPADRLGEWLDDGCDVYASINNAVGAHPATDPTCLPAPLAVPAPPAPRALPPQNPPPT